jgi:hypothetical protein
LLDKFQTYTKYKSSRGENIERRELRLKKQISNPDSLFKLIHECKDIFKSTLSISGEEKN